MDLRPFAPLAAAIVAAALYQALAHAIGRIMRNPPVKTPQAEMSRRFDLHRPTEPAQGEACDAVRAAIKSAALVVAERTPANREQALAITKLEEAVYFGVAAIVRPG